MAVTMADWSSLTGSPSANDFLSMYTSRSHVPSHLANGISPSELQFTPSPTKGMNRPEMHDITTDSLLSMPGHCDFTMNGNTTIFCQENNLEQCTAILNQEVTSLGMASLYQDHCTQVDMVRLINCTHDLLQKHRRSMRLREELENRQRRTESDISMLHSAQKRLKEELERNERELVQLQERERQLVNKNKLMTTKLKAEKDEVRRLQSVIEHRDVQYRHELKRKEREHIKLKDRLQQLLSSRTDRKIAIDIVSPMPRSTGKRGKWQKGGNMEEEMYRQVISTYEQKQKELLVENSDMRQSLNQMQAELVALLHSPSNLAEMSCSSVSESSIRVKDLSNHSESDGESDVFSGHADDLSDAHFQMPYDMVRENIEKNLKEKCKLLKQYIRKIEKQKGESRVQKGKTLPVRGEEQHKKEVEKLNKQIERCREIIEQQEKLLQQHLQDQAGTSINSEPSFLRDSELWEERETLRQQQRFFSEQKSNFERERKIFTDAAIRLGKKKKVPTATLR